METIAVYWEAQIRVYGLTEKRHLTLLTLEFPGRRLAHWAELLSELEDCGDFELVFLQVAGPACTLTLLPAGDVDDLEHVLRWRLAEETDTVLRRQAPVAVLYLYGPHFQDRYGIAEAALGPLQRAGIPALAVGCAGTSVYVVVDDGAAEAARAALAETFVL